MSFDDTQVSSTRVDVRVVDVVVMAPAPAGSADRWQVLVMRRAEGTRCTGAWEIVHGRIERGERPSQAARREVQEETGLATERLYSITVNPFYLHRFDSVQLAVVFAAIVDGSVPIATGVEHDAWEWLTPAAAMDRLAWPREHQALQYTLHLLRNGDAGPVEDVLLVP
jgi:dATP pyrophosphohydrolase